MMRFEAWPTDYRVVTQAFGARPEYYGRFGLPGHEGIDLRAPVGSGIYAVAAGTVTRVSNLRRDGRPSNYGWYVVVDHEGGYRTLYAHLAETPLPSAGQAVMAGELLGYSGNTGNTDGPHLHLTLQGPGSTWRGGYLDPWPYLKRLLED